MFYLAAVYAAFISIGLLLVTENHEDHEQDEEETIFTKLSKTFQFLCFEILKSKDFLFLFIPRYSDPEFSISV